MIPSTYTAALFATLVSTLVGQSLVMTLLGAGLVATWMLCRESGDAT